MMEPSDSFKYAKLCLDEPRDIYYSGQVLTGHIECELSQPITYTAINLNFIGEGNVYWEECEMEEYNGVRRNTVVKYSGHETYFNTMLCVSGGNGVVSLPPGPHKVPFQFQIPHNAPSSFDGERGTVSYKVAAYIEYPDPSMERDELEKSFEVVAPVDLNLTADFKQPIDIEFEEFYSCCCSSSPMTIRIHIPATGFCPGQVIPITVEADNESSVEVKSITFELLQKECYHSLEPKSDYIPAADILESVKTGPILSSTKRENTYELKVPDMIAPNMQNCNIIDVGHFLNVTIKLSGCNDDLEDESEICLGLVPLTSLTQNYKHPMQSDLPQVPIPSPSYIAPQPYMPVQTMPLQNAPSYPNPGPYPNPGAPGPFPNQGPFPNVTPYPPSPGMPMTNLSKGTIGFVVPESPPQPNTSPYPANGSGYPGQHGFPAPYPHYGAPSAPPS